MVDPTLEFLADAAARAFGAYDLRQPPPQPQPTPAPFHRLEWAAIIIAVKREAGVGENVPLPTESTSLCPDASGGGDGGAAGRKAPSAMRT